MKKNIVFVSISVVLLILLGIGLSYSMWNMSTSQETSNVIASSECFDVSITSQENNINLQNAYPISNEKGKSLTPFTFTVTNVCETAAKYSINLESLKGSTLSSEFLDVMLNNGEIKRLNTYSSADKVNSSSVESRELETGILGNKESRDYSLRLWIDYDTTMEDLNNETKVLKSKIMVIGTPINYTDQTVFNFDYTGGEQTFTVPVSGTYKLETWGAQGGDWWGGSDGTSHAYGGVGGYAAGNIKLSASSQIYVTIGGRDKVGVAGIGGGEATYITTVSSKLSVLKNNKASILIVAGGGGGSEWIDGQGGAGGGYIGVNGKNSSSTVTGGTQISGGKSANIHSSSKTTKIYDGSFGQGGYSADGDGGGNGGSGFYGGGASSYGWGGGGGSGYIGNSLLTNKVMFCYNCEESNEVNTKTISTTCNETTPTSYCAKERNGYARITLVSIEE